MAKIGRNSPCPCGSGKKYKRCCLPVERIDRDELLRHHRRALEEFERKQRERRAKYGYVRPIISTTMKDYRLVAVGNTVHYSTTWKTVPDFLTHYLKTTLGPDWGTKEIKTKPLEERHPILQWYHATCLFQKRSSGSNAADGRLRSGVPDGPTAAYYQLAYDLYVLGDHLKLQEQLVVRLKHPQLFQGARYELSVATHCIRAGFEVEHEDETDKSSRHPEFIATHKETGQVIAVEAKSRHRAGVLGYPGETKDQPRVGVRRVVRQALAKATDHPYAVFVDLNLPPSEGTDIQKLGWFQELLSEINTPRKDEGRPVPYNLLIFTNHPQHYGAEAAPVPGSDRVSVLPLKPKVQLQHPQALKALHDAALQYGNIPNWFEE